MSGGANSAPAAALWTIDLEKSAVAHTVLGIGNKPCVLAFTNGAAQ